MFLLVCPGADVTVVAQCHSSDFAWYGEREIAQTGGLSRSSWLFGVGETMLSGLSGLRCAARAAAATALFTVVALLVGAGPATAVPPPPPNPSDSQLEAGRAEANARAGQVGQLTSRLADLDAQRLAMQAEMQLRQELSNKAQVDLELAEQAAAAARAAADAAAVEAAAADRAIQDAHRRLDEFSSGSYQQGSTLGSVSAFFGSRSPQDVLDRAHFLNAISGSQLNALDELERARVNHANKDSAARQARAEADAKQAAAEQAKRDADAALVEAQRASAELVAQVQRIDAEKAAVEQQLVAAQANVAGLESQRQRYQEWLVAKQREEEERARRAAAAAAAGASAAGASAASGPVGASVDVVIARALSQRGVPYAWGGGNASGPTRGVRDGGVADAYGDYNKIGFDCSGLMIYAFAGVGIRLPHYSGYQYTAGRRVPLAQRRPGDMLFWATGGRVPPRPISPRGAMVVEGP